MECIACENDLGNADCIGQCGNGIIGQNEKCEDLNLFSNDGCF